MLALLISFLGLVAVLLLMRWLREH